MSSSSPNPNPTARPEPNPTSNSLYPTVDMSDLATNLFPDSSSDDPNSQLPPPVEETLITIPNAILHLIDSQHSVQLAAGDLRLLRLRHGDTAVAVLAQISSVQWPLTRDVAAVKLDPSHYFFTLPFNNGSSHETLNYGLTLTTAASELDDILTTYCNFSVQKVAAAIEKSEVIEKAAKGEEAAAAAAYWTTLAPNVEEYGGAVARVIAAGSGQIVRGILWCGDVTVDRLKWGDEFLKQRLRAGEQDAEVSPEMMKRIQRVKNVTKMSRSVATGILSGVVTVTGFFTSSIANSKVGKKFFGLLPGEIVLASLDGFGKICDAVEVAGKNVLSTSSTVTTGLVSHRYGEKAAEATNEGLDAAGHAIGTAWAVFKIRKALNPKSTLKPTSLAKSAVKAAASELFRNLMSRL